MSAIEPVAARLLPADSTVGTARPICGCYCEAMNTRLHHASINVTDAVRSLEFYSGLLGLDQLERPPFPFGGAWLDAGNGRQVHLIEAPVPPDVGQHVAFSVDDLDAMVATLQASGVPVGPITTVPGTGIRQAHAQDPDGNRIELTSA